MRIHDFENIKNDIKLKLEWENEVNTEFKVFKYLSENKVELPLDYMAYPWALLIDYYNIKFCKEFYSLYDFIKKLNLIEEVNDKGYITTVQSYHFKKFIPDFKKMGIKFIFSPHITKSDFYDIYYQFNIKVFPFLIYPSITTNELIPKKNILYNFIGNVKYNMEKPTIIRNKISNLNHPNNTIIKTFDEWHFNKSIYGNQLGFLETNTNEIKDKLEREEFYRDKMMKSKFCICPLGIGPNSIRLWECFNYKTIPVLVSDDLWLPFYIDFNWSDIIIKIREKDIEDILNLENMMEDKINSMIKFGEEFNNRYLIENKFGNIIELAFTNNDKFNLLIPWYNIIDELRYKEIHFCLEKNLENQNIKKIILFYESDELSKIDFKKYNNPKIEIIPIITSYKRDITFNRMVSYANNCKLNQLCIISNNDIYFDDSLQEVYKLNFYKENYFVALTRKNYDDYLDSNNNIWKPHPASQDSWIFRSPIKKMYNEINLGWIQCDNIIAENYNSMGYFVVNPHFSVNAWHVHKYNITNSLIKNFNYDYKFKLKPVKLMKIDEILNPIPEKKSNYSLNLKKLSKLKTNWKNDFNSL